MYADAARRVSTVLQTSGRCTLRYCDLIVEFARFLYAADKRCYTSLLICPAAPARKSRRSRKGSGCVENDDAKIRIVLKLTKKNSPTASAAGEI